MGAEVRFYEPTKYFFILAIISLGVGLWFHLVWFAAAIVAFLALFALTFRGLNHRPRLKIHVFIFRSVHLRYLSRSRKWAVIIPSRHWSGISLAFRPIALGQYGRCGEFECVCVHGEFPLVHGGCCQRRPRRRQNSHGVTFLSVCFGLRCSCCTFVGWINFWENALSQIEM